MLILGLFTELDLIILGAGVGVTMLLVLFVKLNNIIFTLVSLVPALAAGLLVMPFPNYRNFRIFITELYNFYTNRQRYVWKGWCANDEYKK
jgi:hypothetical protein